MLLFGDGRDSLYANLYGLFLVSSAAKYTVLYRGDPGIYEGNLFTISGNHLTWWSTDNASIECNAANCVYTYVVLGV